MNPHHFVPPWIDQLDRYPFVLADVERQALGAREGCEGCRIDGAAEGFGEFLPGGLVWEEGLADAKGATVVVGIQEPGGDLADLGGLDADFSSDRHRARIPW